MNLNKSLTRRLVPLSALLLGIMLSVIRIFVIITSAVEDTAEPSYYYVNATGTALVLAVVTAVICVFAAVCAFICAPITSPRSNRMPVSTVIFSYCMVPAVIMCAVAYIYADGGSTAFNVIIAISSLFAAAGFFMSARGVIRFKFGAYSLLMLGTTLFFLVRVLYDFVKHTAAPLDCSGGYHLVSLLAIMLFFLHEARSSAGIPQSRLYYSFGLAALIITPIYVIPDAAMYFLRGYDSLSGVLMSLCDGITCGYIFSRLWLWFGSANIK